MLYRVRSYKLINSSQNNMEIVSNENVSVIESTKKQAIKIKKLIISLLNTLSIITTTYNLLVNAFLHLFQNGSISSDPF